MRVVGLNGEVRNLNGEIIKNPSSQGYQRCIESNGTIYLADTLNKVSYDSNTGSRWFTSTTVGGERSTTVSVMSFDGNTIAVGNSDKSIEVWNLLTGKRIQKLSESKPISSIAISHNGKFFASGNWDKTITIWDIQTGKILGTLGGFLSPYGHSKAVTALNFSPDSKYLASASNDGIIKVWNLSTGELIQTISGHSGSVNSLIFSPDGQSIISASRDNTIKIWQ